MIQASELHLLAIEKRTLHAEVVELLKKENYSRWRLIETGRLEEVFVIEDATVYD